MSAVMSTLSIISGGRRTHRKLTSRKSGQFSDAGEDRTRSHHDLSKQQRSASLQTLEAGGGGGGGGGAGVVNLESLEAKMANIEVSLVGSRRRSAGARDVTRELDALRTALCDKDSMIQSLKKQLSASLSAARLASAATSPCAGADAREDCAALSADERRALEDRAAAVRADLEDRKNNIQELRKRLEKTHVTENIDTRIQQAELQYKLGREELELLTLGEQARALAQLIEQADARARALASHEHTLYSMVRECGGSGVLVASEARDGSWRCVPAPRGAGLVLDWTGEHSLFRPGDRLVEVNGTVVVSCRSQEEAQRAAREAAPAPARLVVLRARPSTTFTQEEAVSLRSELGALRAAADDAERTKEGLRSDNTRLTHRISYLEEQVADLLDRHGHLRPTSSADSCITVNKTRKNVTHINIGAEPASAAAPGGGRCSRSEVQVFQKGPDITAIVAKLPGLDASDANLPLMRPRSNASGASSRAGASPPPTPALHAAARAHSSYGEPRASRMRPSLSHHCIHAADYGAETDAAIRMIERNQRHMEKQRLRDRLARSHDYLDLLPSASPSPVPAAVAAPARDSKHYEIEKAADRIEESIKKTNWAERKTLSIIEQLKRSQRLRKLRRSEGSGGVGDETTPVEPVPAAGKAELARRIDGKVLENAHKSSRRSSKLHSRSARSSEFESECSDFPGGEGGGGSRPTPPRKPLRLSLHRARSAHDLQPPGEERAGAGPSSEAGGGKRPVKRSHATERGLRERSHATPRPPRKLLDGLTAPPAPDRLYPEPPPHHLALKAAGNWC